MTIKITENEKIHTINDFHSGDFFPLPVRLFFTIINSLHKTPIFFGLLHPVEHL